MSGAPAVLALVTDAFGGRGGIAQYNRDLLRALAAGGMVGSLTVLPRDAPDRARTPAGIAQAPARAGRFAYVLGTLRAALARPVDLVFCGHLYMAPLAALIARLRRAKLVVQTHGIEIRPRPSPLRRAAIEAADLVLCVSRDTRARVLGWTTLPPERVIVLPDTVGDAFTPGDGAALRTELGLDGKRVLLTVGRMDARERYKGHDRVITALPGLVAGGHDVIYMIVGEGDDRPRLEGIANAIGVAERVRFLGAVPTARLIAAYRMADLFVMPSTGEGFGIAFLEAMACGTPALGLAAGGAKDALADGELGTAVTEAELPAALDRLLGAPKPEPHQLAAAARRRFGREVFVTTLVGAMKRSGEARR